MWGKNKAEEHYQRGQSLSDQDRYEEALAAYEECLRYRPEGKQKQLALSGKFWALYNAKRYEEALQFASSILFQMDSEKAREILQYMKASILYYDLRRFEEAQTEARTLLTWSPKYEKGLALMVRILTALRKYDEAQQTAELGIRLYPSSSELYRVRGAIFFPQDRDRKALADFEEAIRLDPNDSENHFFRGRALYNMGEYEESVSAYKQALRLNNNPLYKMRLGIAYRALRRFNAAITAYDEYLQVYPDDKSIRDDRDFALQCLQDKVPGMNSRD